MVNMNVAALETPVKNVWTAKAKWVNFEQFQAAQKKAREDEKVGDAYYLLSSVWYKKWERDVKEGVEGKQAPIDNGDLLDRTDLSLRANLVETYDFIFVSEPAWELLRKSFEGGPEIRREVIFNGFEQVIEVYRLNLTLTFSDLEKEIEIRDVSKQLTVDELRDKFLERYPQYRADDYHVCFEGARDPLNGTNSLMQADITSGTRLEIVSNKGGREDHQDENGMEEAELTLEDYRKNKHAGLTGLLNLGYTCFMNSTLQCLSNTEKLTEYFLSGMYLDEINVDNPIGHQGNLAKAYATVIRHLWKAEERSYAPRALKLQIGRYAPQFHGYTQQDSQELMAFLMDGLHEDLNRIKKKPYVESEEAGDTPEDEVAEKEWANHRSRNDSVIVDLFHGQYKSTVVCPVPTCKKVSVTFDPFMYLTLPIPAHTEKKIEVLLVPLLDSSQPKPIRYCMKYTQNATKISDLRRYIGEKADIDPSKLIISVKFSYNSLEGRLVYTDREEITDKLTNQTVMAYEVEHDVSAITSSRESIFLADDQFMDAQEDPLVLVELLQNFPDEKNRYVAMPQLFSATRSMCTGRRITEEVMKRLRKDFDFDAFSAGEEPDGEEAGEAAVPFRAYMQRKRLHHHGSQPRDEVVPDSDEVLGPAREGNKVSVVVEWEAASSENFLACWNVEEALGKNALVDESVTRLQTEKQSLTLDECIRFWEKEETLSEQNAWYCPCCKEHKLASKSLKLWRVPEVLVIHLKRFSYTTWNRNKVDTYVDFPLEGLDLSAYLNSDAASGPSNLYDLYAVSNHMGGLGGGHYTAYAISPWNRGRWYLFDDSSVSELGSPSTVKSSSAYVLFYRRRPSN